MGGQQHRKQARSQNPAYTPPRHCAVELGHVADPRIRTQPSHPLIGYSDGVETVRRLNTTRTIPPNSAVSATIARFHVELPVDGSCVGAATSGVAAGGVGPPEPTNGGSEVVVVVVGEATVVGGKISTIVVVELVVVGAVVVVDCGTVVDVVVVVVNGA